MDRPLGLHQFLSKKFPVLEFDGKWKAAFGTPDVCGTWIIWGASGSGKTRFAVQLCKYLTRFGEVAYNSLEEGYRYSLQRAFIDENMEEVGKRVKPWSRIRISKMKELLSAPKSPNFIIIDSFQYTRMSYEEYQELKEAFPHKLFIFTSHAEGKEPRGSAAQSVRYDCDLKIRVEGYRAEAVGRLGGDNFYTVWEDGAAIYWKDNVQQTI